MKNVKMYCGDFNNAVLDFINSNTYNDDFLNGNDTFIECFVSYEEECEPKAPTFLPSLFDKAQDYIYYINEVLSEGYSDDIESLLQTGIENGMKEEIFDYLQGHPSEVATCIFYKYLAHCYVENEDVDDVERYVELNIDRVYASGDSSFEDVKEKIWEIIAEIEEKLCIDIFDLKEEANETIERIKDMVKNSEYYNKCVAMNLTSKLSEIEDELNKMSWDDFEVTNDSEFKVKEEFEDYYKDTYGFNEVRIIGEKAKEKER